MPATQTVPARGHVKSSFQVICGCGTEGPTVPKIQKLAEAAHEEGWKFDNLRGWVCGGCAKQLNL
jgi:hypothetical protein